MMQNLKLRELKQLADAGLIPQEVFNNELLKFQQVMSTPLGQEPIPLTNNLYQNSLTEPLISGNETMKPLYEENIFDEENVWTEQNENLNYGETESNFTSVFSSLFGSKDAFAQEPLGQNNLYNRLSPIPMLSSDYSFEKNSRDFSNEFYQDVINRSMNNVIAFEGKGNGVYLDPRCIETTDYGINLQDYENLIRSGVLDNLPSYLTEEEKIAEFKRMMAEAKSIACVPDDNKKSHLKLKDFNYNNNLEKQYGYKLNEKFPIDEKIANTLTKETIMKTTLPRLVDYLDALQIKIESMPNEAVDVLMDISYNAGDPLLYKGKTGWPKLSAALKRHDFNEAAKHVSRKGVGNLRNNYAYLQMLKGVGAIHPDVDILDFVQKKANNVLINEDIVYKIWNKSDDLNSEYKKWYDYLKNGKSYK